MAATADMNGPGLNGWALCARQRGQIAHIVGCPQFWGTVKKGPKSRGR